jgi:hypothetical protein
VETIQVTFSPEPILEGDPFKGVAVQAVHVLLKPMTTPPSWIGAGNPMTSISRGHGGAFEMLHVVKESPLNGGWMWSRLAGLLEVMYDPADSAETVSCSDCEPVSVIVLPN